MSAREAILDAAAAIMHEHGIARATTKEIARRAGYSEAALYKHFADKQELFLAVLSERAPRVAAPGDPGQGDVRENLAALAAALIVFYEHSFPISASIFGERELLAAWRTQLAQRGAGPHLPRTAITGYLAAEQRLGRVPATTDIESIGTLLCGAALWEAFQASFSDRPVPDPTAIARTWVAALALS